MTTPDLATRVGRLEAKAEKHDEDLRVLSATLLDVRDELKGELKALTVRVDRLSQTVDQHTAVLDQHTAVLDQHTAVLDQHTGMLTEILGILRAPGSGTGRAGPPPPSEAR